MPETPPVRVVYDPPTDYGHNDGVTPEIESLLRKYAPVIYLQCVEAVRYCLYLAYLSLIVARNSSEEDYFPSSVEYMLDRYEVSHHCAGLVQKRSKFVHLAQLLDSHGLANASASHYRLGPKLRSCHWLITVSFRRQLPSKPLSSWDLATLPLERQWNLWLSLKVDINAQPQLLSNESAFLYGPGGETAEKRMLRRMSAEGIDGDLIRPKVSAPVYAFHVEQEDGYVVSLTETMLAANNTKKNV